MDLFKNKSCIQPSKTQYNTNKKDVESSQGIPMHKASNQCDASYAILACVSCQDSVTRKVAIQQEKTSLN
eukprot:732160-Amphidinium_carterae.1